MLAWLKKWFSDDSDERFRADFEKNKASAHQSENLRRDGDGYADPDTQKEWRQWVDLQRLDEDAW